MKALAVLLTVFVIWVIAAVCWTMGWFLVLALWVWFGPQDPFADVAFWMNLSVLAMTGLVIFAGVRVTAAAFRSMAD